MKTERMKPMKRTLAILLVAAIALLSACRHSAVEVQTPVASAGPSTAGWLEPGLPVAAEDEAALEDATADGDDETLSHASSSGYPDDETASPAGFRQSVARRQNANSSAAKQPSPVTQFNDYAPDPVNQNEPIQVSPNLKYDVKDYEEPSDPFLASVLNFSCNTSAQVLSSGPDNTVFCPISLYYPLALLSTGANGSTRAQITAALGTGNWTNEEIARQCARLYNRTRRTGQDCAYLVANSLWCRKGLSISPVFARTAAEQFYASIYSADFSDPTTAERMQQWVRDNTNGLISPTIDPPKDSILYLCNTVYVKGKWSSPFSYPMPGKFTGRDGKSISCDFMHATRDGNYYKGANYTRGDVSMGELGTMSFFLPDEDVALESLLNAEQLKAMLLRETEYCEIAYSIPTVDLKSKVNLKEMLTGLGIQDAFDASRADFTLLDDPTQTIYIDTVTQEARVTWDQYGAEAAAYTEMLAPGCAPPDQEKPKPKVLNLNRPFLFVIHSNDGILFAGTCYQPG